MRIAVMSDSHDHIWNLHKALEQIRRTDVQMIIHCGDFVAPFMLKELDNAGIPVHGVFGNNDGDQHQLTKLALTELGNITLHGVVGALDAEGFKIGFTHLAEVGEGLAYSGRFQLVCYGHTHEYVQKKIGSTILLNPGEIMGKDGFASFCVVDTDAGTVRKICID